MKLYSLNGKEFPAPLPFRIQLPNGFTRTDPNTFTPEEIAEAGYVGPITPPTYDPVNEQLQWDGTALIPVPKPPETPMPLWEEFLRAAMVNQGFNTLLSSVLSVSPGLYGGLIVGLQQASLGNEQLFLDTWRQLIVENFINDQLIEQAQNLANAYYLPAGFVFSLDPPELKDI